MERTTEGQLKSFWQSNFEGEIPEFPAISRDLEADCCVIGGGITGLTTAYYLAKAGKKVVVLEAGPMCHGETGRTTAHLMSWMDDRFYALEELHGSEGAKIAAAAHRTAIDMIEQITHDEQIDCDFHRVPGYLMSHGKSGQKEIDQELFASGRCGTESVLLDRAPLPAYDSGPCLRFSRQGQFHPLKYMAGLINALEQRRCRIFCHSRVSDIEEDKVMCTVKTEKGFSVRAANVIVATNVPINDRFVIHTKQSPYRSYVIAAPIPIGSIPQALYWDTAEPYHYVRLAGLDDGHGNDYLIVGGEDHHVGQNQGTPDEQFERLEKWARERFPFGSVTHKWSGQIIEPVDGLAYIGHNPNSTPNVYIATGDSGQGMTHGTIAGRLLTHLITGVPDGDWEKVFDPSRKNLRAIKDYVMDLVTMNAPMADWVTPGNVRDIEDIVPGCGGIVRKGVKKYAVYRETDGTFCTMSAVCPHLGGLVRWNDTECTFDCPCHGSRFDCHGHVLNGPANRDLTPESNEVIQSKPRQFISLYRRSPNATDTSAVKGG